MRVEHPVAADLPTQPEPFTVGRQQQLDRRRVEADAVIERRHAVAFVDPSDHQHAEQDLQLADQPRVAREEGLDLEWPVRRNDDVDPGRRDIDAR